MNKDFITSEIFKRCISMHNASRYIKFIFHCNENNSNLKYFEKHHILPQSKHFWPQFSKSKWNIVKLTPRQHFIAHVMLAKALGSTMWFALNMMKSKNKYQTDRVFNSYLYEALRTKIREQNIAQGKARIKTQEEIEKWKKSRKGYSHSDETKRKIKESNELSKRNTFSKVTIKLYQGKYRIIVNKYTDKLYQYYCEGWQSKETKEFRSNLIRQRNLNKPKIREVRIYYKKYYCLVLNRSNEYFDLLDKGGSLTMTEEYKTEFKRRMSEVKSGSKYKKK